MIRRDQVFATILGTITLISCSSPRRATSKELLIWEDHFTRNDAREKELGKRIEIEGTAENAKLGARVNDLWIDGLDNWPEDLHGKKVNVKGTLIRRDDLPVFRPDPNEPPKEGIPVPEGVDLERARRRYLIADAHWTKLPN